MEQLTVAVEPGLVEELKRVARQQGATFTVVVNLALKEFVGSMEDEFELDGVRAGSVRQRVVAVPVVCRREQLLCGGEQPWLSAS